MTFLAIRTTLVSALALSALTTLALTIYLIALCGRSFDVTDQAFYLHLIARPGDFPVSVTQFGFIYHPLFAVLGEDVALLRQVNLGLTFALANLSAYAALKRINEWMPGEWPQGIGVPLLVVTAAAPAMLSSVFMSTLWLPTPSYNTLAFQGLLIASAGFCFAGLPRERMRDVGWFLLGLGGFLAFMAKPTSAAALAAVILAGLLIDGRLRLRGLAIGASVAMALALVASFAIAGGPLSFIRAVQAALDNAALLGGGHTASGILRWDAFHIGWRGLLVLCVLSGAVAGPAILAALASPLANFAGWLAAMAIALIAVMLLSGILPIKLSKNYAHGLQLYALLVAALIGLTAFASSHWRHGFRSRLALVVVFAAMPFAYIFGTNGNYWHGAATGAFFFGIAAFAAFARPDARGLWHYRLAPLAIAALALSIVFIRHGLEHPYRDTGTLAQNTEPVSVGRRATPLQVTKAFADYFGGLQRAARDAGFTPDTPVIDLTGHYPGALFALGAKPLGAPWLIGGYSGSERLAKTNLDQVSCAELSAAWVLREPEGPRRLPDTLLSTYGIDLARDFTIVGSINSPAAEDPVSYRHDLLKPARDTRAAEAACRNAKGEAPR